VEELAPATILSMAVSFQFEQCVAFERDRAAEILRAIPALPGVFALRGTSVEAQPYLTRAADLRRRIARMLAPAEISAEGVPVQSKRLNLRGRVAWIEYSVTGSEFESRLTLYRAAAIYGLAEARRRLRLHTPFFLRFTAENAFPRVYSTNRLSRRALSNFYGPFPSRAAADRYCDAVLDLFKLRRCSEELAPYPEHPGCVYQEMKKCLAPCNQACTAEGAAAYSAEAAAVEAFFETRGESLLGELTAQREEASAEMEFEQAAQIHAQVLRVKAAAQLADELVRSIPRLRAVIVQAAAEAEGDAAAAVFLIEGGALVGPARLSTLGVRAVKEQTEVGSSLFAQPLMLQAVPLAEPETGASATTPSSTESPVQNPEERAAHVLGELAARVMPIGSAMDLATLSDHLSLLRRWYYRPEKQRVGEIFFSREDGTWPIRRILRGAARMALGDLRRTEEPAIQTGPVSAEKNEQQQATESTDTLPPACIAP